MSATGEAIRAVVLLSGGLDSATVLALARGEGRLCHCLCFDYGQRHRHELQAARRVAAAQGVEAPVEMPLNLRVFGGSALTDDIEVPRAGESEGIPVTYVPARNLVFLSLAAALAEVVDAAEIWIGVNAIDYSGYPDCRPAFIEAFERAANLATRAGVCGRPVRVRAPLIALSKAEIIRRGAALGVDYALTHSCYDPDERGRACGRCDSCVLRRRGFAEAGVPDPTVYAP
ncbi:MAG: 7-cyano-7-deazaguanine synthase QueC [Phycisphaerales bacterium]|nr:7-cyano-7-deazaguanine synthase QueC [Phycisphaerales bacterium]